MSFEGKPKVVIIGAGNLATNLAIALYSSGCQVLQVFARRKEAAIELATKVKSDFTSSIYTISQNADIYFICVPDKVIKEVAENLLVNEGIIVHTSGSTDIEVLSSVRSKKYGVFYPFQTFSKARIVPFSNIPICLNANSNQTFEYLNAVASMLSNNIVRMDSRTLTWLHLTGVITNNFTNHLLAIAHQISKEKGFDFELVKPLIEETIKKAFDLNPIASQTGPAIRNDQSTINLHIEKLKDYSPELADIYKALTLSIQSLAKKT